MFSPTQNITSQGTGCQHILLEMMLTLLYSRSCLSSLSASKVTFCLFVITGYLGGESLKQCRYPVFKFFPTQCSILW